MNDTATADADIQFSHRCWLGHVVLNRPKAFNALTQDMCVRFDRQMREWSENYELGVVAVTGAGERAFCAGGDVRALWAAGPSGGITRDFFWDEYRLNRRLFRFSKPYIAVADGITMGGGVGISAPARIRLVSERTMFAMPETAIGLFPDVGASYYLSRCPGQSGMYLALTGARIRAADLIALGLYTHYVPSTSVPEFLQAIELEAPAQVLKRLAGEPPEAQILAPQREAIDRCFAGDTIEAILDRLKAGGGEWAQATLATLGRMSPLSLRVTLRLLREAASLEFEDCLRLEYRLVRRFMKGHDFYEGVRAVLVDKDNTPKWRPATLADATPALVDSYFAPFADEDELNFDE
jgi:enoyl-CoA hydratase